MTEHPMTDATPLASEQITQEDRLSAVIRNVLYRSKLNGCSADVYDTADEIVAALSTTAAPSDQDASQAQGEIPEGIYYNAEHDNFYSQSTYKGQGQAFWEQWRDRRHEFPAERPELPHPAPGATAQDGVEKVARAAIERCNFCDQPATTSVADDSDTFDCCDNCEAAWRRDPGFMKDHRATPTIPAGMVAEVARAERRLRFIAERYGPGTSLNIEDTNQLLVLLDHVRSLAAAPKQSDRLDAATVERCAQVADAEETRNEAIHSDWKRADEVRNSAWGQAVAAGRIADAIRALATDPHQHGGKGA